MRNKVTGAPTAAAFPAVALLAVTLVLGGGGSPAPVLELVLQLVTAALAAWWLLRDREGLTRVPKPVWWIFGLIVGLHILQLIPLPPGLWQGLPGRATERAALELVNADTAWRALTISPPRTLASLLAAAAALAALTIISSLDLAARWRLVAVVAGGGFATLLIGAAQLAGGSGNPARLFDPESPYLTGFQANHNSTADVILIAMLACAALGRGALDRGLARPSQSQVLLIAGAIEAVLALGLFFTGSRTGMVLALPVFIVQFLIFQPKAKAGVGRFSIAAGLGIAGLGLAALLLRSNRAIEPILARFTLHGEFRPELWRDTLYALGQYWPAGSGMGTFSPVMIAVERLEVVDPTLPNRAHNDYLELALTGGLPGLVVFACVCSILIMAAVRSRHVASSDFRLQRLFAMGVLMVVALHSLVDFPLRSMALAGLAAMAAALLIPARKTGLGGTEESRL